MKISDESIQFSVSPEKESLTLQFILTFKFETLKKRNCLKETSLARVVRKELELELM